MAPEPIALVSMAEMRALEGAAFATGTTEAALQERAGAGVARVAARQVPTGGQIVVLVGHGNNGRDGAVAARHLASDGLAVSVLLGPRHAVRPDELKVLQALGVHIASADEPGALEARLGVADMAIDALLGIGATGPLREPLASYVTALNRARADRIGRLRVLAVDIPTGVDADTGSVAGAAVHADLTVTLGAVKQGLLRFPAAEFVGDLVIHPIGLSATDVSALPYHVLTTADVASSLPRRPLDAHKYRFGRVLVIAGSEHYLGAPVLCVTAAARAGAGLVTLACSPSVRQVVASYVQEVTYPEFHLMPEQDPEGAALQLAPLLRTHRAVVIGPGLGRTAAVQLFVRHLLRLRAQVAPTDAALVVDADALSVLAEWPDWWRELGANVVLTPHSGELERLVGTAASIDEAPWVAAGRLAQQWGVTLVAKGPFTSVATADRRVAVWPHANPALATGGTGDVLAGVCGGLLAQGLPPMAAAQVAVTIHARAGAAVVAERGWRTLLASDLLPQIPRQLHHLDAGTDLL